MKHIKIHSFTHLLHLIYCLILALPLCTILVRCIYVQFNKNAFESYYGETINDETYSTLTEFKTNIKVHLDVNRPTLDSSLNSSTIYVTNVTNIIGITQSTLNVYENANYIRVYKDTEGVKFQINFDNNGVATNNYFLLTNSDYSLDLEITNYEGNISSWNNSNFNLLYDISYNDYSYLDNAFEYSIHKFVDNSNIGRLNLVNWFTDVFLDSSNATNMLYLNFINWYMNYALLVSCVYILFLVLMWFVSLARRLIYKGMEI